MYYNGVRNSTPLPKQRELRDHVLVRCHIEQHGGTLAALSQDDLLAPELHLLSAYRMRTEQLVVGKA